MNALPGDSVEVRISVRSTAEGGRRHPVFSGYRASFWLGRSEGGRRAYNDAGVYLTESEELAPGQTGDASLVPLRPEYWRHLRCGDTIEMSEGSRVVGIATVLAVHPNSDSSRQADEAESGEALSTVEVQTGDRLP